MQNPGVPQAQPDVGLHTLVGGHVVVEVHCQGDSKWTVSADKQDTELDPCETLNIQSFAQTTNSSHLLTFHNPARAEQDFILHDSDILNFFHILKL